MTADGGERVPFRDAYHNAWTALRMIRETIEALGPPGAMASHETVLRLYGPEPEHEGQAIVDALTKVLSESKGVKS